MHPPQTGRPVEADGRKHDLSHCAVVGLEVAAGEHRKQPDEAADDQRGVLERCARALTGNGDAPMRLGLGVGGGSEIGQYLPYAPAASRRRQP